MKKLILLTVVTLSLNSCQDDENIVADPAFQMQSTGADYGAACSLPVTPVAGDIVVNTFWDNNHVWEISGVVRVKNGATLSIEEGTFIKADPSVSDPTGVLVITKDGFIDAHGTVAQPIVFTSHKLLDCAASGDPEPGDFGGMVILGSAPVNTGSTTNVIEGLDAQSNIADFYYGGSNSSDNSGALKYVRIEYAGKDLTGPNSGNEINGLTFGGVGSGTVVDHIQVTYGLDDGFEWFGGTVNASYLVSFGQADDAFDFDLGYTGKITRALAMADANGLHSDDSGGNADTNGIESDSDFGSTPVTRPNISYMSVIGVPCQNNNLEEYENGVHTSTNGGVIMTNSIVTGYGQNTIAPNTWGIYLQGTGTTVFANVGVFACRSPFTSPTLIAGVIPATSPNFGMIQPFYNGVSPLNFAGANNGAFTGGIIWTTAWTKFSGF